jgi:hypothetical protein
MTRARRIATLALCLGLLAPVLAPGGQDADPTSPKRIWRWESNLSAGSVSNGRLGIVKALWWYPVPKILAVGLSFDYIAEVIPLSINAALNAPITIVVPFACAGAGTSLTTGGITHYGGGIKIRLGRRLGLIGEYRKYHYSQNVTGNPPRYEKASADYFGGGIAWVY